MNNLLHIICNRKAVLFFVYIILIVSCRDNKSSVVSCNVENCTIDLEEWVDGTLAYECTNRLSDEFCDLELIPLENNSDMPLGEIIKMQVCDSGFYIQDNQDGNSLFFYKNDGSFGAKIGQKGHSRVEYTDMWNFSANAAGDTVAMLDYNYIRYYDQHGKFIKADELNESSQWQGFLFTYRGLVLSTSNRGIETVLALYANDSKEMHPIIESPVNLIRDMPSSWQNLVRTDGDRFCYYDYYSSTFRIYNLSDMSEYKSYILRSSNILTEDKATSADVSPSELDHLNSYVYEDNTIFGSFQFDGKRYDFKLDCNTDSCLLNHHIDMGYSFLCTHDGWYYRVLEPAQLLQITDPENFSYIAVRELLENALQPYEGKILDTDNYYILRMRRKKC